MVPDTSRHKLRNLVFHEFLDRVRHLYKPLIAPFIVPSDDLNPRPLLGLLLNPFGDLLVGSSGRDKILEVVSGDSRKSEKEVIERTIKVVFAGSSGESWTTLVQGPGRDHIPPRVSRGLRGQSFERFFAKSLTARVLVVRLSVLSRMQVRHVVYGARGTRCRNIANYRRALMGILNEILCKEEVQSPVECNPQLLFQAR